MSANVLKDSTKKSCEIKVSLILFNFFATFQKKKCKDSIIKTCEIENIESPKTVKVEVCQEELTRNCDQQGEIICTKESQTSKNKTCVINDPLGQTHSPTSSDHYFQATFVLFCDILKSGDGRSEGRAETCTKVMITTCLDCGAAEWINND